MCKISQLFSNRVQFIKQQIYYACSDWAKSYGLLCRWTNTYRSLPPPMVLITILQKTNLDHCTCSVVSCIIIVLWKNKTGHIFYGFVILGRKLYLKKKKNTRRSEPVVMPCRQQRQMKNLRWRTCDHNHWFLICFLTFNAKSSLQHELSFSENVVAW